MYSNTITYRPSQLFYSQDSIMHTFRDGVALDESLSDLLKSPTPQQRLPPVEVMVYDGKPFVIDGNRRLFLLKKLENVGLVGSIKVVTTPYNSNRFMNKYTTHNEGLSIRIRNDRYMELKIDKIIKSHKREKYHDQSPRNPSADINARYVGFTSPIGASQRYYGEASQSKLERNSTTRPELSIYGGMASRINPAPGTGVSGFASPIGASQRYYGAASQPKLERNSTTRPELSVYSVTNKMVKGMASQRGTASDTRYCDLTPSFDVVQQYFDAISQSKPERKSTKERNRPESSHYGVTNRMVKEMASQRGTASDTRVSGLKPFIGASQRHHGAARESKPERNSTNETNQPESFDHGGMASQRDTATGERKVSSLIKMFSNLRSSRSELYRVSPK